jgi:hypothetical protein
MSTNNPHAPAAPKHEPEVIIFGHSQLLYWWPVWVLGYVMALLTWFDPIQVPIDGHSVELSTRTSLGVIYALVVVVTVLITNTSMRGAVSLIVVIVIGFLVLLFTHLGWWDAIFAWFGHQPVYMDLGFYVFFSTAILIIWLLTVIVFDHLSFWRIRPGQVTHEYVLGAVEESYDTDNMVFTKTQSDLFRHWGLGLVAGDLKMQTMGGRGVVARVSNVLFLSAKVARIQRLIATKPDVPQQA